MYKVILVLGLGFLIFVAPVVRADVQLDAQWHWNDNFNVLGWDLVTDTYPLSDWLLPVAERQALSEPWTIAPVNLPNPPGDGSLWNMHWSITGIVGNSGHNSAPKTSTEFKLGNTPILNTTGKDLIMEWTYDGNVAMNPTTSLTVTGHYGATSFAPTLVGTILNQYNPTKHTGTIWNEYFFNGPVNWENFVWTFPTNTNQHLHAIEVESNITSIPEPGTLALLGLALPFAGLLRRRKVA